MGYMMAKTVKVNGLCRMCKNSCKEMYKYGIKHVKEGCYFINNSDNKK